MIDEVMFANRFTAVWSSLAPLMEHFVRSVNLTFYERYNNPIVSKVDPAAHAFISEAAFLTYGKYLKHAKSKSIDNIVDSEFQEIKIKSEERLGALRGVDIHIDVSENIQKDEIVSLARSIDVYFNQVERKNNLIFCPSFRGTGYIDSCEGDFYCEPTLVEIKNVQRNFRAGDFRQTLIYAALAFAAESHSIGYISIVNPRRGVYFKDTVDRISEYCSGKNKYLLFEELIYVLTSGEISR